jgi:hypothetical protein
MSESLQAALGASQSKRALYEQDGYRVFVSERHSHFDFGLKSPTAGQITKFDQTGETLDELLLEHGISKDVGWNPQ